MTNTSKAPLPRCLTPVQSNYIKGLLRMQGEDMVSLGHKLKIPWGTLANNINGYRSNPQVRQAVADFLGKPVETLFGDNGGEAQHE